MKRLLYSLLCTCFLFSCSGAADDAIPDNPSTGGGGGAGSITGECSIKLGLNQNGRNIFEPSVFNIQFEFEGKPSYNYITSLYRQPAYDRNSSELADKYNTLFSKKEENVQPCAIWLTRNAKIVLLKKEVKNNTRCWIYAEPE